MMAATEPSPTAGLPVVVGRVENYTDLHHLLRARIDELGMTLAGVDGAMGDMLPTGYSSKLFSPIPSRRLGLGSVFSALAALGLDWVLVNSPQKRMKYSEPAARTRKRGRVRKPLAHSGLEVQEMRGLKRKLLHDVMRELGKKGGRKSAKSRKDVIPEAKRRKLAKIAARARWAGHRPARRRRRSRARRA